MHICRLVAGNANTSITLPCIVVICALMCPLHLKQNPFFLIPYIQKTELNFAVSRDVNSSTTSDMCTHVKGTCYLSLGWKNDKVEAVFMFTNMGTTIVKSHIVWGL
jgi:hypothetical protein